MSNRQRSKLWVWIVMAFIIQIIAWTIWFTIAGRHPVEEVPLTTPQSNR